eukprot:11217775-Lingulodinium_polyedra.AAC.1
MEPALGHVDQAASSPKGSKKCPHGGPGGLGAPGQVIQLGAEAGLLRFSPHSSVVADRVAGAASLAVIDLRVPHADLVLQLRLLYVRHPAGEAGEDRAPADHRRKVAEDLRHLLVQPGHVKAWLCLLQRRGRPPPHGHGVLMSARTPDCIRPVALVRQLAEEPAGPLDELGAVVTVEIPGEPSARSGATARAAVRLAPEEIAQGGLPAG